jgi:hypothetical protein
MLNTPEPLWNLVELDEAQAEFHQRDADILEAIKKGVIEIQMQQEADSRKARDQ